MSVSFDTLLRQASMTANEYMVNAIQDINRHLGPDYAAKHPELIAAYMQTAALDMAAMVFYKVSEEQGN